MVNRRRRRLQAITAYAGSETTTAAYIPAAGPSTGPWSVDCTYWISDCVVSQTDATCSTLRTQGHVHLTGEVDIAFQGTLVDVDMGININATGGMLSW
jgi:hypothetical protein